MPATPLTNIFSPYHIGTENHRLEQLGLKINFHKIEPVDDFEGEIGRSFKILRRTSIAVSAARAANSFPIILSGNCTASVGVAAGLGIQDLGFIYFDAHDDLETPSTNTNGYFDAMGLSMLAGKSWHALVNTIPNYQPLRYDRFVYCELRDIRDSQRKVVEETGPEVIWGNSSQKVDYLRELRRVLERRSFSPALVHLDLDVLDESLGKVNGYESPGGLFEDELIECMEIVPRKAVPVSLTVCSFNPQLGDGEKIAKIALKAIMAFVKSLLDTTVVSKSD